MLPIIHNHLHALHHGRMEMFRGQLVPCVEVPERVDHVLAELRQRGWGAEKQKRGSPPLDGCAQLWADQSSSFSEMMVAVSGSSFRSTRCFCALVASASHTPSSKDTSVMRV